MNNKIKLARFATALDNVGLIEEASRVDQLLKEADIDMAPPAMQGENVAVEEQQQENIEEVDVTQRVDDVVPHRNKTFSFNGTSYKLSRIGKIALLHKSDDQLTFVTGDGDSIISDLIDKLGMK